jgi:hypothetical protein
LNDESKATVAVGRNPGGLGRVGLDQAVEEQAAET